MKVKLAGENGRPLEQYPAFKEESEIKYGEWKKLAEKLHKSKSGSMVLDSETKLKRLKVNYRRYFPEDRIRVTPIEDGKFSF